MSMCCVSNCDNRPCRKSKIRFHRIPSVNVPYQAERRKLWVHAIQQANNSSATLSRGARVCGAHFISGEMSLDHNNVDFIPSVFPKLSPEEEETRSRKRGRPKKEDREEEMKPPEDEQAPILMETESDELVAPYTRSQAKEAEKLTAMAEAEKVASTITSQTTSSPIKTSPLEPAVRHPVVVLQPLILQAGGYQFELCSRSHTTESQPVEDEQPDEEEEEEEKEKCCLCEICGVQITNQTGSTQHQCVKPEEPSFPCNMCDRSFTSYHCLKRHKLLHVKDGRKCGKCGVLFCRLHNHTPFRPATDFKEASSSDELQTEESNVKPENGGQQKSDLSSTQSAMTVKPRRKIVRIVPKPPTTITIITVPTPSNSTVLTDPITAATTVPTPSHSTTTMLTAPITATTTVPIPSHSTSTVLTPSITATTTVPTPSHSTTTVPTSPIITITTTTVPTPSKPQPLSKTHKFKPPAKGNSVRAKTNPAPPSGSCPPPTVSWCSRNQDTSAAAVQPPKLPSSLRLFSPQYLTSAVLQVTRNYEYILSKSKGDVKVIKEEPSERPISPVEQIVEQIVEPVPKGRIAYDLEIVV